MNENRLGQEYSSLDMQFHADQQIDNLDKSKRQTLIAMGMDEQTAMTLPSEMLNDLLFNRFNSEDRINKSAELLPEDYWESEGKYLYDPRP